MMNNYGLTWQKQDIICLTYDPLSGQVRFSIERQKEIIDHGIAWEAEEELKGKDLYGVLSMFSNGDKVAILKS